MKGVSSSNGVITPGPLPTTTPLPGQGRIQPALFVRTLFCLRGGAGCRTPAHVDILAHDPYSVAGPTSPALNRDDVSVPDLGKLTRPLRAAERRGTALPRGRKRLWVTEFSWDSSPPDPQGVPVATQARWLEEALHIFWRAASTQQCGTGQRRTAHPRLWEYLSVRPVPTRRDGEARSHGLPLPVRGRAATRRKGRDLGPGAADGDGLTP